MNRSFLESTPGLALKAIGDKHTAVTFQNLLNLLHTPALLWDAVTNEILFANQHFQDVTSGTLEKIAGRRLSDIVEGDVQQVLVSGNNVPVRLMRNFGEALDFQASSSLVDVKKQIYTIVLNPITDPDYDNVASRCVTQEIMRGLANAIRCSDIDQALSIVIDQAINFFNTDIICIYMAESEFPRLKKVARSHGETEFPIVLPSTDLIRLGTTLVWESGRRVATDLHRAAKVSDLEYVFSAPLGEKNAGFGLFVIAGKTKQYSRDTEAIEVFASIIQAIYQQHMWTEGLLTQINAQEKQSLIHKDVYTGIQDGVIIISPKLLILDINPAVEWLLGYSVDEVLGKTVDNILIGPDRIMPALEAACLGETTYNLGDCSLHRRNGQSFPARVRISPVDENGKIVAVIIFIYDLSEQVESQRNSQQLEQRAVLGDFTAIFAHDLRNPINNISTGMQLMLGRLNEDDPNYSVASKVLNDCSRIDHLMESVLTFARSMELRVEAVDVNIFMRRLLDRWRPAMMRANVQSVIQVADNTPPISGDPRLLDRLFTNLINNAIDAMKTTNGGTIAVKAAVLEQNNHNQVIISLSDTGPGIPDEVRPRIFEPFVTTKQTGTGLGLAICKRIVTVHKGTIHLESFPGGTVFHIKLPIYEGDS